jgi:hydrogenase maturation protease
MEHSRLEPDSRAATAVFREPGRTPPASTLVLGFGNVLLGDDGAGVRIALRLRDEMGADAALFVDAGTLSFSLLSYVEDANTMLIIDAADLGAAAGSVECFEGAHMDRYLQGTRRRTVHEIGLIDLLDMARILHKLPARRALLCIQPSRIEWSEALTPVVSAALPEAIRTAKAVLKGWQTP